MIKAKISEINSPNNAFDTSLQVCRYALTRRAFLFFSFLDLARAMAISRPPNKPINTQVVLIGILLCILK